MKIGLVSVAASAMLALSTSAFAQAPTTSAPKPAAAPVAKATTGPATSTSTSTSDYREQSVDGSQVVEFIGDSLKGDENSAYGFTMRSPPRVLRALLIRPRVNFVSELVKSVENL